MFNWFFLFLSNSNTLQVWVWERCSREMYINAYEAYEHPNRLWNFQRDVYDKMSIMQVCTWRGVRELKKCLIYFFFFPSYCRGNFNTFAELRKEIKVLTRKQHIAEMAAARVNEEIHDVSCCFCTMKPIPGNLYRCLNCEQVMQFLSLNFKH